MAIDKDKLLAVIESKAEYAYGSDTDSEIARHRANLIEAYLGMNTNPAPEGRSQIVDRSVFETVSTMLPSLVRVFASSSDEVCKFVPVGPEDEPGAEQTTAYVNHVVTQKNAWEQICADWIHDTMLLGNGYAMAYWDEAENVERERYEGQGDDQLAALLQDPKVRVVGHSERPDPELGVVHDVEIERGYGAGCVRLSVLPPENCLVDADCPDASLERCDYFEYREEKTVADLAAQLAPFGVKVPMDVADDDDLGESPEDDARDRMGESRYQRDEGKGPMRKVVARMIWVRAAAEGEETRLYYVVAVGKTILYAEPCSRIPVASMCAIPLPHRHPGLSVAEIVLDQQQIKTAVKRGGLDNLYLANNGRYAISEKVNLDDFLDSRPGGVVRLMDGAVPGEGHVFPLQHPFAFPQIIESLEYFDQERQNRSGASRYFSGTDAGAINKTASGVAQLTNQAAQRVEHYARMMAPAVEYLFSVVLELISKHQTKGDIIKLRGKWTPVDPQAWMTKRDVRISVGVGAGNKDAMLAQLSMTLQEQLALAQVPGLVKPENLHATAIEKMKLQGFANPDRFYSNPAEAPPQPPPVPPEVAQKMQQELAKLAEENAKLRLQHEAKDVEMAKKDLEVTAIKVETGLQQKALDIGKQEIGLTQRATEMTAQSMNGDAERKAQEEQAMKEELAGLIQAIVQSQQANAQQMAQVTQVMAQAAQAMTQVAQAMSTPKRRIIERDPQTNRVVGMVEEPTIQ